MVTILPYYPGRLAPCTRDFLPHGMGRPAPEVGQDAPLALAIISEITPHKAYEAEKKELAPALSRKNA